MDIFEQKGARYELALTQYLAATSVPDGNEAHYALLFAAREYFRSEGVMSYVGKINVIMERDRETIQSVPRPAKGEAPTPIITASPIMKEILETARIVARTDASVLIRGPSGTDRKSVV
jgi:transcriptional regulator with PAS, ATPase and Fis domain